MSDWREQAACAGSDPEQWFREGVASPTVLRICAGCPVLEDCRTWVLDIEAGYGVGTRFGVVAGLTPAQRASLDPVRRRRSGGVPGVAGVACLERVGSEAGYERHRRRHETPCGACSTAHQQRRIERERRRAAEKEKSA